MSEDEKNKLIVQTRSRVVVIPKFVEEDIDDSEDEDYEPSSEDSEDEEQDATTRKRKAKDSDDISNKKRVIDVDAEVVLIESDDETTEQEKNGVDKIWEEMNKETSTTAIMTSTTTAATTTNVTNSPTNNIESPKTTSESKTNETTDTLTLNNDGNNTIINESNTIESKSNETTITESTTPLQTTTTTTTTTSFLNKSNIETEIVEFAGEKIEVKKTTPPPPKPMSSKKGLNNLLSSLSKPKKINTLEKSKLDWDSFKDQDETEKHIIEQQKKDGYLERKNFLDKVNNGTL
ncbi:hypothetical protein RB653_010513 [Dictyostelium firmibasis]|uniref:BCNT-C domain-containing protein n=1 Tax=Dictyostelium firmibasis TaxID=79012 RepID=A0AAN7YPX8_9MYCE